MKTKFSQLLKVKQRRVDEIESELLDSQNQKKQIITQIDNVNKEISEIQKPVSGDFAKLHLSFAVLSNLSDQKERYAQNIEIIEKQIKGLQVLYKEANIEFEKVKHLEDQEITKALDLIKIEEKKEMDEIANLLYMRKSKELKF